MIVKMTSPPEAEPVSLPEAKLHLKVETDVTTDDTLITNLVTAAREWCEAYEGRKYMTQTLTVYLDAFEPVINLPYPPVQVVNSIMYVDLAGAEQELSKSLYTVDAVSEPARVYPAYGKCWPATRTVRNAVSIEYDVGYVTGEGDEVEPNVPARVKQAMLLLIGEWYVNRGAGDVSDTTLRAVESLLFDRVW